MIFPTNFANNSPEAYHDQRMDKLGHPDQMTSEEKKEASLRNEIEQDWIKGIEGPIFSSAQDLQDKLGKVVMVDATKPPESLHGNDES